MRGLALLLLCLCTTLSVPAFADDDDDSGIDNPHAYHLRGDLDLVAANKMVYDKPKIIAQMVYPSLTSDDEADDIEDFNDAVNDLLTDELKAFQLKVNDIQASLTLPDKFRKIHNRLNIDFDSSSINLTDTPIFSIRFVMECDIPGMAHPYRYHRVLNMSLDDGEVLTLNDLFKPDANYLFWLSDYTSKVLAKKLRDRSLISDGTSPTPDHFKNWNIEPSGLRITFDEATVAPYMAGTQTVVIPYSDLQPLLNPDSALAKCLQHQRRCLQNHVITGGFMN